MIEGSRLFGGEGGYTDVSDISRLTPNRGRRTRLRAY